MKKIYPYAKELLPNQSEILHEKGPPVRITVFKDSDHAHDIVTMIFVTGILLLIDNMPVKLISKRQKTVETSNLPSVTN